MLQPISKKLAPFAITFAAGIVFALPACADEKNGSCVVVDAPDAYCIEDKDDVYCSGSGHTFYENSSCSAVGFAYYCTPTEMRESGSTIYGSARYLRSSTCDSTKPADTGGSSSSGGSSSGGSSSGGSSSGGSSSGTTSSSGGTENCSSQDVQGCTMTFCAGPNGCYWLASGSKFDCASCDDTTDCAQSAVDRCQGN